MVNDRICFHCYAPLSKKAERNMSTLYEIVELENGDVALQRSDESGEPLLKIKFSEESIFFLSEAKFDVAKAMIEAGLEAVSDIQLEMELQDLQKKDEDIDVLDAVLH